MVIDDTTYSPCGKNELFHERMSASIIELFHKDTCCDDAAFYYLTSFFTSFFIHLKVKSIDEKKEYRIYLNNVPPWISSVPFFEKA